MTCEVQLKFCETYVFWDMTTYSLAEIYFHLTGICCLQLRVAEGTSGVETSVNIWWTAQG